MLWSVCDTPAPLQPFIKMKHGPYLVRDAIVNGEKVHISEAELNEDALKEYNHFLQKEYNTTKNDYYSKTDYKTGVITKPRLISWNTIENIEIPISDNSEFTRIEEKMRTSKRELTEEEKNDIIVECYKEKFVK